MKITNRPVNANGCKFNFYDFPAARDAFEKIITLECVLKRKILLPAFIGQSSREGSGVFDPIRNTHTQYEFYKMDDFLKIDVSGLRLKIINNPGSIVLLIHYWGFFDPSRDEIKSIAKDYKCVVVEDFAHALFSFFKFPVVDFDYGFFSLHKMFSCEDGGVLIAKNKIENIDEYNFSFFEYNLFEISNIRVNNYNFILNKLIGFNNSKITIFRNSLSTNIPQTFPILLKSNALRDSAYFKMNALGFGVVSLYHQLIDEVDNTYEHERDISLRILNLPVHQDVNIDELDSMLNCLNSICDDYEG